MSPIAVAGRPVTLFLNFFDLYTGLLTDPAAVQLDITYGEEVGFAPDAAGPFFYSGASSYTPGQIWRIAKGQFAFTWPVPITATTGVYVANWTSQYGGASWLAVENFPVTGGTPGTVPAGDIGFWTGSLVYNPAAGNLAAFTPLRIGLGEIDSHGIAWLLQKVEGWDSPDVQGGGILPNAGDHGGVASQQFDAPRALTITITASAPTQALRDLARQLLQYAIPVNDLALFTFNEPVAKQALIRRSGKIAENCPTLQDVTFTVGAIAPDPRKYGTQAHSLSANARPSSLTGLVIPLTMPFTLPAQQPAGAAAVTNAGNFESRPVITIRGPITSPALANVTTGQTVSWSGLVVPSGSQLVADFGLQQGLLDGGFRSADLSSSWWTLPGGPQGFTSTIQLTGQSDTGASMVVAWQDAYA